MSKPTFEEIEKVLSALEESQTTEGNHVAECLRDVLSGLEPDDDPRDALSSSAHELINWAESAISKLNRL